MDFDSAVQETNRLLRKQNPHIFSSSWIRERAPHVYRFIQKKIRSDIGVIDWDRFTRALDRRYQRQWISSWRKGTKLYQCKNEVDTILRRYNNKLYTFLAQSDENDRNICDIICIALVRIAQKGNTLAIQEIIKLVRFTIDQWIETYPQISRWDGYDDLIQKNIEGCIRRYRYSGSFMGYLFKTLQYAGRGMRPIIAYSLEDTMHSGEYTRSDKIGGNPETGEILQYS